MIKLQIDGRQFRFTKNRQRAREVAGPLLKGIKVLGLLNIDGVDYALIVVKSGWYYIARDDHWEPGYFPELMEALKK